MKQALRTAITHILEWQARAVLARYQPKIVAVTGNVGKTSAKDAIYTVLSQFAHVRRSEKSFNSEIGIPLTVLGLANAWNDPFAWAKNILKGFFLVAWKHDYPEWLVLEVGADRPGDIRRAAKWLKTDIVVFTRFGEVPVHVEFFKTPEDLFVEKSMLVHSLKKDGTLILNADDPRIILLKDIAKHKVVTFGFSEGASLRASNDAITYHPSATGREVPAGITFRIDFDGTSLPVSLDGAFGKNHVYSALVALAVAHDRGLPMLAAAESLKAHQIARGRMCVLEGVKDTTIIDDTYNSSPLAAETALGMLADIRTKGKRIAGLGDMLDLGRYTPDAHKQVGAVAAKTADILVTVGMRARYMAEGALDAGMSEKNIYQFEDSRKAGKFIESILEPGDLVLLKGSQGMRMERAVEEIMAHPEQKDSLLVRQDEEWLKR